MKFRLGFLKRRHTEGTIHSTSVRPPPEEAQKWANSFTDLMASKCKSLNSSSDYKIMEIYVKFQNVRLLIFSLLNNFLFSLLDGQALFKAFLQRDFCDEALEFWLACEDYKKTRQNKLNTKAQKIYNDFIIPQAPKEVNLDSLTKDGLAEKIAQPTHSTFDQAQKRIQGLLEADAYSRFIKSDLYLELVHPEKYPQSSP